VPDQAPHETPVSTAADDHRALLGRSIVSICLVVIAGTAGYMLIEGWTFLESLYMTVITITTIGYREMHPPTTGGMIFTLLLIFGGIGVVTYTAITGAKMLIEGEVTSILSRRRSMKAIGKVRNHFVVCGYGRMGSFICHELHARGLPFVVVEKNPARQTKVLDTGYLLSPGDATEEEVLTAAGIRKARGLVSVLDSDAANVYAVLTARELNENLEIIARAAEEAAHKKLMRAGASRVISPYQIGGMRMVMGILKPTVMSFLELAMDHKELDVEMEEIRVSDASNYRDKRLVETGIRKEMDLIVVAVKKKDGQMVFNPGPYTIIESGDTLVAMGERSSLGHLREKAERRE
jgi:voltage-gated potassium channel